MRSSQPPKDMCSDQQFTLEIYFPGHLGLSTGDFSPEAQQARKALIMLALGTHSTQRTLLTMLTLSWHFSSQRRDSFFKRKRQLRYLLTRTYLELSFCFTNKQSGQVWGFRNIVSIVQQV